jgi:hypothetical protein
MTWLKASKVFFDLVKFFWIQITCGKTLVIFRIENIGQLDIIYSDLKIFKDSNFRAIVLTRDCLNFNHQYETYQSRFYPFIFNCLLFIAISQNMRVPPALSKRKIYLLPYGYFAKGISLLRYRKNSYRNIFIYNSAMKSYIQEFDPSIKSFLIAYPKAREINRRDIRKKTVLIAPSYDQYTSLNIKAILEIVKCANLKNYKFTLKAHPRFYNSFDKAYQRRVSSLANHIEIIEKFDNLQSLSSYEAILTDYSSIAYEGVNLGQKVLLYWSPRFIFDGLIDLGVKSKMAYLRDDRINSGFRFLPKVRNAKEVLEALNNYNKIMNTEKAKAFKHSISNRNPSYLSIFDYMRKNGYE